MSLIHVRDKRLVVLITQIAIEIQFSLEMEKINIQVGNLKEV